MLPLAKFFYPMLALFVGASLSCVKEEYVMLEPEQEPDSSAPDTVTIYVKPSEDPKIEPVVLEGNITVSPYADLSINHQSAAVYGDFLFLVMERRQAIRLFDMAQKRTIYTFRSNSVSSGSIYHCNQSTFGTQKYDPADFFPLLYISQRSRSENRCFTEVLRIIPLFNADSTALLAFRTELVQEIFFPPMSKNNSMGNANCVIDAQTGSMYTYSRNNAVSDENYGQCKISRFAVPDFHQREVFLEDSDIDSSFMIDATAVNMQGGCIVDGRLYIGQGSPSFKEVYLNVVDLQEERLVKRYDLLARGVDWEPEGCFYYDGNVMLSYTDGISRIVDEE